MTSKCFVCWCISFVCDNRKTKYNWRSIVKRHVLNVWRRQFVVDWDILLFSIREILASIREQFAAYRKRLCVVPQLITAALSEKNARNILPHSPFLLSLPSVTQYVTCAWSRVIIRELVASFFQRGCPGLVSGLSIWNSW